MKYRHLGKKLLGALLAAALMATPAAAFADTEMHWAAPAIDKWSGEYSIIQGYEDGTFRPDNYITRGAFAGIMDRFLQFQNISPAKTFSDTAGNYWEDAILKLHAAGVYLGNNGKALPKETITRQQAVTMIARAFGIVGDDDAMLPYGDGDRVASYARGAVSEMSARGYITDSWNGDFRPTDPITRAEMVSILDNMIQRLVQTPGIHLGDAEGTVMINSADGAELMDMFIPGDLILAPGVKGPVRLTNVDVLGAVYNFSSVEPEIIIHQPEADEDDGPGVPAIQPYEVYEPGKTTGDTILYDGKKYPVYKGRDANEFGEGDFYWEDGRLVYDGRDFRTRFGIDVSAYQNRASENETIDWEAVADDGVDFVMVRIGLRGTSTGEIHADAYYRENIEGAMEAGIETGVYFFAQAITVEEAIEEAEFVLELLEDLEIDGPVAYDWEMHNSSYRVYGTTPEMATACAVAFCERVAEEGYTPMVYAGTYVTYIKYDQGALADYLYWYPEYKNDESEKMYPTVYYQMDYWQFSSDCYVDGIGGRVDGNIQFIPRR